ncbi:uncharacterized protein LOC142329880 isoform X2 [Lycorma delicatula]|uniref:uncharacterized protein LOC142329880 isoform X2 n=1 Tax=Lycorma delicatula TaxID=130591 RepID=UPI003F5104BC
MAKKTDWALSAINRSTIPDSLTTGASKLILNQERWSERFQDLSGYCNIGSKTMDNLAQQSGEQLNTPVITNDGFDFGLRSLTQERFDGFEELDPWEASPPLNNSNNSTNDTDWEEVNNWLLLKSNNNIQEEDLYNVDIDAAEEKPHPLMRLDRDILLSQSPSDYNQLSCFDSVSQSSHDNKTSVRQEQLLFPTDMDKNLCNNNNNSDIINMNNVLNSNTINNNNNNSNNNSNNCFPVKLQPLEQQQQNLVLRPPLQRAFSKSDAFVNGSFIKNRRDPETLSSIFKSEEPFIGECSKPLSSCSTNDNNTISTVMSNNDSLKVDAIIISPEVIATTSTTAMSSSLSVNNAISRSSTLVNSYNTTTITTATSATNIVNNNKNSYNSSDSTTEYIIPDSIKPEPIDISDIEVETIHDRGTVTAPTFRKSFKIPSKNSNNNNNNNMRKSGLKLDIDSAARLVTSAASSVVTPTISMSACDPGVSLSTPDVLRPLLNSNGEFNLLTYINDDLGSTNILGTSRSNSPASVDFKRNFSKTKSVRQSKKSSRVVVEKCESAMYEPPTLPSVLPTVKEENVIEDINEESQDHYDEQEEVASMKVERSSRRTASKRRRVVKKSEDMESDLSNISDDYIEEDDEEHDKTFHPTPNRRKRTFSSTSRSSSTVSYTSRRKLSRETDSSDYESVTSGADRYRELRDRNNEASRRSRLNRKSREMEMKQQAVKLEQENKRLKAKADEMERLVKRLREGLMQLVLKKH